MTNDKTYNGWTNYETWRVNLEIFDGVTLEDLNTVEAEAYPLSLYLKDYAEELIECSSSEGLARDYALAFLSAVNFREIAQSMINNYAEA